MCTPWPRRRVVETFVLPGPFDFDPDRARAFVQDGAARAGGLVPVLSHERLSGNPHSGGYDSLRIARRLQSALPRARVLLVIREQRAMIASSYKQYVHVGGPASLDRYLDPPRRGARVPLFDPAFLCYDRLVHAYRELFGADRVLVLPVELLARDQARFVGRVVRFAGGLDPGPLPSGRRNAAVSALTAALERRVNLWAMPDSVNPGAPFDLNRHRGRLERWYRAVDRAIPASLRRRADGRLQARVAARAGDRYRESNRRTSELAGIDLGAFGYDC